MLFSLLKQYLDLCITDTALKVSWSLYCFISSVTHGLENYFPKAVGMGISDIMASLRVRVNIFSSKTTRQRHAGFFLKDTLTIEDDKLLKACKSVCLSVLQSHYKWGAPTQSVKISTLDHNFLIHYCRDFSIILHICTRPLVNSLVWVSGLDLS